LGFKGLKKRFGFSCELLGSAEIAKYEFNSKTGNAGAAENQNRRIRCFVFVFVFAGLFLFFGKTVFRLRATQKINQNRRKCRHFRDKAPLTAFPIFIRFVLQDFREMRFRKIIYIGKCNSFA